MENKHEDRVIEITEKELMEIMAEEVEDVINIVSKDEKKRELKIPVMIFLANFSSGILKKLAKRDGCSYDGMEENLEYEPYHYSERGDK